MRHGYLIDMDGVLCRGREMIPGADAFIRALRQAHIPFLLLTNNSQRSRRDIATMLQRIGIPVLEEHIFTSAIATARFLARMKPGGTAYVIGEGGLTTALHINGFAIVDHAPDFVVVGEGRTVSYEQLEQAVSFVTAGARLIATNLDPNCPTESGLRPGCGAIVALLEKATGRQAFSVGKPSPVMLRAARKELNLRTEETCIIGDTMATDILGGVQLGFHSILVLSGSTRAEDLEQYAFCPDFVVDSVADLVEPLLRQPDTPLWRSLSVSSPAIPSGSQVQSGGTALPSVQKQAIS
ncbi:MAG: HAD-IIA family hydrolase [Gemmatales bacterium]|nr:HAD-IIA family hydrolase [Gemmatales bacterium]MDW8223298.1 HAD-IIA family hydrolase [Gemmatales bacterium]